MIIAVDAGKHMTKAMSQDRKTFSMRTKLDARTNLNTKS